MSSYVLILNDVANNKFRIIKNNNKTRFLFYQSLIKKSFKGSKPSWNLWRSVILALYMEKLTPWCQLPEGEGGGIKATFGQYSKEAAFKAGGLGEKT